MASDKIVNVTDATFEAEVLKADKPTLIDFWASWCAPCKAIAPIVDELAAEYEGKIKVTKMNVDENPSTPSKYGVRGIPTLLLFKEGNVVDQKVGAVPKSQLADMLKKAL